MNAPQNAGTLQPATPRTHAPPGVSSPPDMAPMTRNGSRPDTTASGSGASGDSCDRSACSRRTVDTVASASSCDPGWSRAASGTAPRARRADGAASRARPARSPPRRPSARGCKDGTAARHGPAPLALGSRGHGSVCTSTDKTGGRSRTMGIQRSLASAEAYTCPPVVPKYTPQRSSVSTAIASRSTFT